MNIHSNHIKTIVLLCAILPSIVSGQSVIPGAIKGAPSVSSTGAFTYSIPITLPPGIKDLTPKLSLEYNSQSGNGLLGIGWSLGGVSAIARVSTDIYHDGNVHAVNLDANDVFALDGQRLLHVGGSSYTTAVADFSEITSYGTVGSGPAYFIVESQDGLVYEFGNTADSRMIAQGSVEVLMWALCKVSDRNGNHIDYHYSSFPLTGNYFLDKISYGGNSIITPTTPPPPVTEINFNYQVRGDDNFRFAGGSGISTERRLINITIRHEGSIIHQYDLNYMENPYSHLTDVTETSEIGNTLPATVFNWGPMSTGPSYVITSVPMDPSTVSIDAQHVMYTGDFNGDGYTDCIGVRPGSLLYPAEYVLHPNVKTDDFSTPTSGSPGIASMLSAGGTPVIKGGSVKHSKSNFSYDRKLGLDFDGDGKQDLLSISYSSSEFVLYMYRSTGTGFATPTLIYSTTGTVTQFDHSLVTIGDFLGNGKQQVLVAFANVPGVPPTPSTGAMYMLTLIGDAGILMLDIMSHHRKDFQAMDFDGDGKDELFTTTWSLPQCQIFKFNTSFNSTTKEPILASTVMTPLVTMGYPTYFHSVFFGDFNGDGKKDVLTYMPGFTQPWEIGYSKGNNFGIVSVSDPGVPSQFLNLSPVDPALSVINQNYRVADFNGDGKDDILEMLVNSSGTAIFKTYYSKGDHTFIHASPFSPPGMPVPLNDTCISVGDFNGDGAADILEHRFGHNVAIVYFNQNDQRDLLTDILKQDNLIPSFGQKISVTYEAISQDIEYQPISATPSSHNKEFIHGGLKVVKTLKNNRTSLNQKFIYSECLVNRIGLGLRGFKTIKEENPSTLDVSFKTYDLESFETPVPKVFSQHRNWSVALPTPPLTSRRLFAFDEVVLPNNSHVIYPVADSVEDYGNGSKSKTIYTYLPTTSSLQNFGKPDKITTNIGNGTEISVQEFTYNTSATEFYNRDNPAQVIATNTRVGSTAYSRTISYTYNTQSQVVNVVSDPGTAHQNIVNYGFDVFGNVTSTTSTVAGTPSVSNLVAYNAGPRFATRTTNAAGESDSVSTDKWGNRTSYTDLNGLTTLFSYDDFNRSIGSTSPTGIITSTNYLWANSLSQCPAGIYPIAIQKTIGGILGGNVQFFDYEGNTVRFVAPGFNGTLIYNDAEYAADGTLTKTTLPYYSTSLPIFTTYGYDAFRRKIYESSPSTNTDITYSTGTTSAVSGGSGSLNGLTTTVKNLSATPVRITETIIDASGKTIEITEGGLSTLKFEYHSNGKLSYTAANGLPTYYTFDDYGNTLSEDAPNKNTTNYTYDNRNRIKTKTDANSLTTTFTYDILDRVVSKNAPGAAFNYTFGTAAPTIGKMIAANGPIASSHATYAYDGYSRLTSSNETTGGMLLSTTYTFDAYNRISSTTYPDGNTIQNEYNSFGRLAGIWALGIVTSPSLPNTPIWRKDSENALGQTTSSSLGIDPSAIISVSGGTPTLAGGTGAPPIPMMYRQINTYNPTGFLTSRALYGISSSFLGQYNYTFDEPTGDLVSRTDVAYSATETFSYDVLDRLTSASQTGLFVTSGSQSFVFDPNGNMTRKTDISTYDWTYDKYAVSGIPLPTAAIPTFSQTATYTPFDKVSTLVENGKRIIFTYKPNEQRGETQYFNGTTLERTKYYASNYEKSIDISGTTRQISYVMAEGKPVAMFVTNGTSMALKYIATDYQGSITHILNNSGSIDEVRSYDVWGRMRDPMTWGPSIVTSAYDRGYTSQELLADFNVINLNGRLYDPLIGRMFSADPVISNSRNAQTYNSYSYANNNPLKYTDKSGYSPALASAAFGAYSGYSLGRAKGATGWNMTKYILGGAAIGLVSGAVGGSIGGAVGGKYGQLAGGAAGGFSGGFISGAGSSWMGGSTFGEGINDGAVSGTLGGVSAFAKGYLSDMPVRREKSASWNDQNFLPSETALENGNCDCFGGYGDQFIEESSGPIGENAGGALGAAIPIAATAAAVDGPLPIGDFIGGVALAGAATYDLTQKVYVTYTLTNSGTGAIYVGRTSGYGDPQSIMMKRYYGHEMRVLGYGNPTLDRAAQGFPVGYYAIRGREQDVVNGLGGVGSVKVGNRINPIWRYNPNYPIYMGASYYMFGQYSK